MSSKETNKLLKADNLLLQAKLDDALAEIQELNALVDYMDKNKGVVMIAQPDSEGLFRIDQINIGFLHREACRQLKKENIIYDKHQSKDLDDEELFEVSRNVAAQLESMEYDTDTIINDNVGELMEIYKKRLDLTEPVGDQLHVCVSVVRKTTQTANK